MNEWEVVMQSGLRAFNDKTMGILDCSSPLWKQKGFLASGTHGGNISCMGL